MAFQQGLSGLASSSKAIDVVSNNIANTSTVGFKAGTAQFADVYASALTGAVSTIQIGIGSTVNAVKQAFNQGNLTATNNPLDMAINGNGFFMIARNDGTTAYSRNGQFDIDKDGFVVTNLGERLMGYQSATPGGGIPTAGGTPVPLYIPPGGIDPQATSDVLIRSNLDSRQVNPANLTPPGPAVFDPNDPESYNATTSLKVFDTLGNDHTLTLYFVRTTTTADNSWQVFATLDGDNTTLQELTDYGAAPAVGLTFDAFGRMDPNLPAFNFTAPIANGAVDPLDINIDLSRMTQFGSPFSVTELNQNGYAPGEIAGLAISRDGIIQGRYTNGQTRDLGQVALATFRSPNGLISLGNNLWAESPESGPPIDNKPGAGLNGVISAGMVEDSNVDLTQELVQLIIQQRNYQANAQSIRTQDQLLQTLVNLR
jgi:flagellar hook protein FlgE